MSMPDPIFAALERHIVARDALLEAIVEEDEVAGIARVEDAAFLRLFVVVPTTLEGRRALLQHLVQRDADGICEPVGELAARLLRLPMFAGEEVRS